MNLQRTFFVTSVCANRKPIFRNERAARLFMDVFFEYREHKEYSIHAFVLMPDHLHAILTPADFLSIEKVMQFVKGGSSFRLGKILATKVVIWQPGFKQHRIVDKNDLLKHVEYIHQNPVRAGLAKIAEGYLYSSAHPGFQLDDVGL